MLGAPLLALTALAATATNRSSLWRAQASSAYSSARF